MTTTTESMSTSNQADLEDPLLEGSETFPNLLQNQIYEYQVYTFD